MAAGARLTATRPADGEATAPGEAVVATLEIEPGWDASALCVRVDGEDVTARCAIRTDRGWPPRRADVVLPDVGPGEHRASLEWPGVPAQEWRFAVAER
jgi:hypothetical protein